VGSAAQIKAMKQVAGTLRLDLAQFRELEAFAQFGSDLDEKTKQQIERGKRGVEVLKQAQYSPLSVEHEVCILYALTRGHLDDVAVESLGEWEKKFHEYLDTQATPMITALHEVKAITPEVEELLKKTIEDFKKSL
jgi:F-type H+-transporting ATPase subunit alpha